MSGSQMQHAKEANADIMRQKQAAGTLPFLFHNPIDTCFNPLGTIN
jgi:hypothetical protein